MVVLGKYDFEHKEVSTLIAVFDIFVIPLQRTKSMIFESRSLLQAIISKSKTLMEEIKLVNEEKFAFWIMRNGDTNYNFPLTQPIRIPTQGTKP